MFDKGNNGNNLDLMLSVRHEPKRDEITGDALLQLEKLKDRLNYKTVNPNNAKYGVKNKKHAVVEYISVKDLITVYKWLPQLCSMATFLPIFSDIIKNGQVLIEDVPKFDSLMYKVMGE